MKNKAFTLIELLVVISIIGLLSSIVLASLDSARAKARDAKRESDLKQLALALELFWDENAHYTGPESCSADSSIGGTGGNCTSPTYPNGSNWATNSDLRDLVPKYISVLPIDPINSSHYNYRYEIQDGATPQNYALCARLERGGFTWQGQMNGTGYFNGQSQPNPVDYCDAIF